MVTLRTLLRLSPWVLGATLASLVGLWVVRLFFPFPTFDASNDVIGSYLQTLGSIYAVLLAFVVFVVWQQFNDARAGVEREASEIVDLFRMGTGLPESMRRELEARLLAYVDVVLGAEWAAMRAPSENGALTRAGELLDEVFRALCAFEPCTECHKYLHAEAFSCFNELSNARTYRLSSSRLQIPAALRALLYLGAVIVVGSTWILSVESLPLHSLLTGALAGAVSHVLYVIEDLDDCFSGDWQVPKSAFERARAFMVARAG